MMGTKHCMGALRGEVTTMPVKIVKTTDGDLLPVSPTIHQRDEPWFLQRKAVLDRLRRRKLVTNGRGRGLSVVVGAVGEELDEEEREVIHKLLGYSYDPDHPLIAKRVGVLGGRAAIAGRRTPVWRIVRRVRSGETPAAVAAELELTSQQVEQALAYAEARPEEIEQDLLDYEALEELRAAEPRG
jgi:uncharacterized protein (DUF433 family)